MNKWGGTMNIFRNEKALLPLVAMLSFLFCEGGCAWFVSSDGGLLVNVNATCPDRPACVAVASIASTHSAALQARAIELDGDPSDWSGMQPLLLDAEGDSRCGSGTDLTAVFMVRSEDGLFWRVDGADVRTETLEIVFADHEFGHDGHRVRHRVFGLLAPGESAVQSSLFTALPGVGWEPEFAGPGFASAGETVEGFIPLHLFRSPAYQLIAVRVSPDDDRACDEVYGTGEYVVW
jgi:hypothetical protein